MQQMTAAELRGMWATVLLRAAAETAVPELFATGCAPGPA
jgi:hypothetical protein